MSARCHRFAGSIFLASGISHFSFFRLITTGTARWLFAWADGDEQPPGALERASSCTAARTGVAGLGTARCDRRGVAHRAALRPDLTWLLSCFKDRPDPGGQLVRFDRVRRRQHKPRWSDRPPSVAVSQTGVMVRRRGVRPVFWSLSQVWECVTFLRSTSGTGPASYFRLGQDWPSNRCAHDAMPRGLTHDHC